MNHEIIYRNCVYLGHDCYAYTAICTCGLEFNGWFSEDAEMLAWIHILKEKYGIENENENLAQILEQLNYEEDRL